MVGTFMYQPIADSSGFAVVMWVQAALSLLGAVVTYVFIEEGAGEPGSLEREPLLAEKKKGTSVN